jgi:hypothetical protein
MKLIYCFLLILFTKSSAYTNNNAKNFRDFYYGVCKKEIPIKDFDSYLELHNENKEVLTNGYKAVIWFLWANYYLNPLEKWKCFNKGKKELEALINENKNNSELRFLRLTIQENIPSFLGYNSNREEDKYFLNQNLSKITDNDLHTRISNYLNYNSTTQKIEP